MLNIYEQVDANKRKSSWIMIFFTVFVGLFVWFLAGYFELNSSLVGVAFIVAGLTSFLGYYFGDKLILTISHARPADRQKDFKLYTVVQNLAMAAQIPEPKVYVIQDTALNAFATGRDPENAVVCATSGLIERLDRTELEGVISHEISHIRNYDIRLMSLVTVLVGLISLIGDWFLRGGSRFKSNRKSQSAGLIWIIGILFLILSPIIARLVKLAISRQREYLADASATMLTRFPDGLARALEKISQDIEPLEVANKATAHLYIANPLKNRHDGVGRFASLFLTHPPIADRINRLRQMV
ncbi:M48 family metallopeptidase [Patescibacteria group bacterium]|nr:M48 family metallopeptidase [Patescibacteria group bacterium]